LQVDIDECRHSQDHNSNQNDNLEFPLHLQALFSEGLVAYPADESFVIGRLRGLTHQAFFLFALR
jgi:hypothetical protein